MDIGEALLLYLVFTVVLFLLDYLEILVINVGIEGKLQRILFTPLVVIGAGIVLIVCGQILVFIGQLLAAPVVLLFQ